MKMKKDTPLERIVNGIYTENPVFCLVLGMCPTLAVTTSAMNAIGMGLSTTAVLVMSNLLISLLRKIIPDELRIPAYIVVIASFVTMVDFLMAGFTPSLYESLGIYIPLIVVNCIILGRAEAYANKNTVGLSVMDAIGMGIGFTVALILAGSIREILGSGTWFGLQVLPKSIEPMAIFVQPPGAFLVIALFVIILNAIGIKTRQRKLVESGCDGCCANCEMSCEKKEDAVKKPSGSAAGNKEVQA